MPKVPVYQQQVRSAQMPTMRVNDQISLADFGAGQSFNNLMNQATSLAVNAKRDADDIAVAEAKKKLADFENNFTYGENGMITKTGKEAFNLKQELDDGYQKLNQEILDNFSNDSQRGKFIEFSMSRKSDIDKVVMRHISVEREKYDDSSISNYIESEKNNIIGNIQNPDVALNRLRDMDIELAKYGSRKGFPPEQIKTLIETNRGKVHSGVISHLISIGKDAEAESYYKSIKDVIPDSVKPVVEKEIELGTMHGKAQRFVDAVVSKGLTEGQAYALSKEVQNQNLRDEIETRISRQFKIIEDQKQEYQKNVMENAIKKFDETGQIDVGSLSKLEPKYAEAFKRYRDYNPLKDDGVLHYKLYNKAIDPKTRQSFANEDLLKYIGSLSKSHFEELMKIQSDIKTGRGDKIDEYNGAYTDAQIIESNYRKAGYNPKKAEEYSKFKLIVDKDIEKYKVETGKKKITNDEIESIVNKNLVKIKTDNILFSREKAPFEINISDISRENRNQIREALSKKNIPVDDQKIIKYYLLMKEKGLLND